MVAVAAAAQRQEGGGLSGVNEYEMIGGEYITL